MSSLVRIIARSKVTSKGQTTVPKEIRDALRLNDGAQLEWFLSDGKVAVTARTVRAADLAGFLGEPPNGRHLTLEQIDEAIGDAAVKRFTRSQNQ